MRRTNFTFTEAHLRGCLRADSDTSVHGGEDGGKTTSRTLLKLYELDFGTGNPSLALPPELNDIVQIQCSRPVQEGAPAGDNGVEMFVNLPPSVMERLRTPEARAKLAGFDCY